MTARSVAVTTQRALLGVDIHDGQRIEFDAPVALEQSGDGAVSLVGLRF